MLLGTVHSVRQGVPSPCASRYALGGGLSAQAESLAKEGRKGGRRGGGRKQRGEEGRGEEARGKSGKGRERREEGGREEREVI